MPRGARELLHRDLHARAFRPLVRRDHARLPRTLAGDGASRRVDADHGRIRRLPEAPLRRYTIVVAVTAIRRARGRRLANGDDDDRRTDENRRATDAA